MRKELNNTELDNVVGGTVIISKDYMNIGFSSTREMFNLKNVSYRDATNFRDDLLEANPGLSNAQFDALCKQAFMDKGWI